MSVEKFFKKKSPEIVLMCAAKVGGIQSNFSNPYEFLITNLTIQNNLFNACLNTKLKSTLFRKFLYLS